jgi:dTDP-4-dehydrorhamnose reductase
MPNHFLILGSSGMLGRAWRELLAARQIPFTHGDYDQFDITDQTSVAKGLEIGPATHVINCAAWTDVDGAEANEAGATRINGEGVRVLAEACAGAGAMLVHYSTDYVFDGNATTPYRTDQRRQPLNAYGRSKAAGEEALERSHAKWLCLRTSWLYAPWGKNFLRTIAGAALTRPQLKVVDDQRGRPTSAEHLARATLAMIDKGATGMHHLTDGGECTWFEFAREIVETLREQGATAASSPSSLSPSAGRGADVRIGGEGSALPTLATVLPCASAEFPRPAKRPAYSVLDLLNTEALIGPMPDWKVHVRDAVRRREG